MPMFWKQFDSTTVAHLCHRFPLSSHVERFRSWADDDYDYDDDNDSDDDDGDDDERSMCRFSDDLICIYSCLTRFDGLLQQWCLSCRESFP